MAGPSSYLGSARLGGFSLWASKQWRKGEEPRRMEMNECTVWMWLWMYEKDKINKKSGSCHQTFQNVDIFQKVPDCFGSFRNCSVCFGCFDTGSKHRNKRKKKFIGFTKQTETNAKQILFRFVSVRTEIFFFSFRGHPNPNGAGNGQKTTKNL